MTVAQLLKYRLHNQQITSGDLAGPADVVSWLGAVQAQDYNAAKWALGTRLKDCTDHLVDCALGRGSILRTHVLRPTWHLVTPADIGWMLDLTAPRIKVVCSYQYPLLGLDEKIFTKSNKIIVKALEGGTCLTRNELISVFNKARIPTNEYRFIHIMMRAELDKIVCSGPKNGKQHTYALFADRVPASKPLSKDEALARLALRYFSGHGPATIKDFAWWSGLTVNDATTAVSCIKKELIAIRIKEQEYWMSADAGEPGSAGVHLLPAFDEYLISYADRSAALDPLHTRRVATINGIFYPCIVVNGKVVGTWKRAPNKKELKLITDLFTDLTAAKLTGIDRAARRFGKFIGSSVTLT